MTAKSDNRKRVRDFFAKEYNKLVNYIYKYVDTRTYNIDPEDIVQDIALNIFEKIDFNIPIENVASYLYRAIRNKIIDYQRKPNRDISLQNFGETDDDNYVLRNLIEDIDLSENEMQNQDMKLELHKAMEKLKPDQLAIILETEFEGSTFEELSERWSVPIGTLLSRKSRAVNKLKQIIKEK